MDKIEVTQASLKPKIELSDADFVLYQTLQELIIAIRKLSERMK